MTKNILIWEAFQQVEVLIRIVIAFAKVLVYVKQLAD